MQISITERANDDLIDIWLYGYEIWGESNVNFYLDELDNAIQSLTSNTARYPEYLNATPPFRLMPFRSHLIAYEVVDDILIILRVLHKNMDTNSKIHQ